MQQSLDLSSLSAAYESGTITPLDVVDAVYSKIDATPHAGVFICELTREQARAQARDVMARRARGERMRLYGTLYAVKDNIDVEGLATTAACPEFSYVAQHSAACVEHLREQGAILIGKTNLDQFATGLVGVRSAYGIPKNPFDEQYVTGGSSSGSAVAVALGFCSFALSTDTAGSGRVPAAFNDLVGLKPTRGMLSTRGVVPACRSLDCVGVLALTVRDAAEVAHALAGHDPRDPYSERDADAWDPRPAPAPSAFRFGVPSDGGGLLQPPYSAALFDTAMNRAVEVGGIRRDVEMAPFERVAALLYDGPFVAERLEASGELLARNPAAIHPVVREILAGATTLGAGALFRALASLHSLRSAIAPLWAQIDCLLVPSAPTIPKIEAVLAEPLALNTLLGRYTNFVNLLDLCALAVPAGFAPGGLPFGITLIAPRGRDALIAAIGEKLHVGLSGRTAERPGGSSSASAATQGEDVVQLAVVGAHLSGEPLNHQLTERGARLLRSTRTTPNYRLFALPTTPAKPGLVRTASSEQGTAIEVEVWQLSSAALGSFMSGVFSPLCIGRLELADGSSVLGFLCEAAATLGQRDISAFGGWRNFRRSLETGA
jgi:allophanate hydrolase